MKRKIAYLMLIPAVLFLAVAATNLTTDQIWNQIFDSTDKSLRISVNADSMKDSTALTNTATYPLLLEHETSGTPASGIGVGLEMQQQTSAAGNEEVVLKQAAVMTDVTGASEDADWVLYLMKAGAAATEAMRVTSTGVLTLVGGATLTNTTPGTLTTTSAVEAHTNSTSSTVTSPVEQHTNTTSFTVTSPVELSTNTTSHTITSPVLVSTNSTSATVTSPAISLDGAVTINDSSADLDTRIETNDDANAFIVDAGDNAIKLNTWTDYDVINMTSDYSIASAGKASVFFANYTAVGTVHLMTDLVVSGRQFKLVDKGGNSGANNITVDTQASEKINGADTLVIATNSRQVNCLCDGTNWFCY